MSALQKLKQVTSLVANAMVIAAGSVTFIVAVLTQPHESVTETV